MDSSLDEFNFTDDEIREQLELLGFKNVTETKFKSFKKDLKKLIQEEKSSEESQIFTDELNKIKREKLSNNPYLWDEYNDDDDDYDDVNVEDGDDDDYNQSENDYVYAKHTNKNIKSSLNIHQTQPNYYKNYMNKLSTKPNISTSSSTKSNVLSYNKHNDIDKYKKSLEKLHETNAYVKRKISRKLPNGSSKISSNYVKSSPSHSLILENNFNSLNINANNNNQNDDDDDNLSEHSTIINEIENNDDFGDVDIDRYECKTDLKNYDNDEKVYKVKSFIRSQSSLSTRFEDPSRIRKNNPVNRYHEYSKLWKKQKAPGEKSHAGLRWSIREKMLDKHVVVKKQPSCQPTNDYIIPTDKKRQDLRWIVRNALANNVSVSK